MYRNWVEEKLQITHNDDDYFPRTDLWNDFKQSSHYIKGVTTANAFYSGLEKLGIKQQATTIHGVRGRFFFGVKLII